MGGVGSRLVFGVIGELIVELGSELDSDPLANDKCRGRVVICADCRFGRRRGLTAPCVLR